MAAEPAPKRNPKHQAAVPANDTGPLRRSAAAPANDNWPRWLRFTAAVAVIAAVLAALAYAAIR